MGLPTTIAACHHLIFKQEALLETLTSKISAMEGRIKELESQLSQNSHRPPSSDGYHKKAALARKSKGRQDGKPGHNGKTVKMVATADYHEPLYPERCSCGAPLLRGLNGLKEQGSRWAGQMHKLLRQLYEAGDEGRGKVEHLKIGLKKYGRIHKKADQEEPPPEKGARGRAKQTKGRNLLGRLTEHRRYALALAKFEGIPFTNNLAKRDLRPAKKIKQKVSGRNVFNKPGQAINGQSFTPMDC